MSLAEVAASAPGKVLFAGGFLVLDRQHTGLVFGLDARIHIHIQPWLDSEVQKLSPNGFVPFVFVQSPQFRDARWLYRLGPQRKPDDSAVQLVQVTDHDSYTKSSNKFVETTLRYVLTYLAHIWKDTSRSAKVTVIADNDYYSQTSSNREAASTGGFRDFGVRISEAHKTGLGSSAALVTALVAALLRYYTTELDLQQHLIHNLAQVAHCAAQGKIGSGFDVAAAVYGSCVYRRFSPSVLEAVGESNSPGFGERLVSCVKDMDANQKWDTEIQSAHVQIPDTLTLVMCDVDCGSESPGMAKKILNWRKTNPEEAGRIWTALQLGTDDLADNLQRLSESPSQGDNEFGALSSCIEAIRTLVREMSTQSDVPVEPTVITELLDYCTSLPGVIGGVAPGAGGYDAVSLLIRNDEEIRRDLQTKLEGWASKRTETTAQIGHVRLLDVKQSKEGIRAENPGKYQDWIN